MLVMPLLYGVAFLSTLPARGATRTCPICAKITAFLSTLPARGATALWSGTTPGQDISIHAPREGSDLIFQAATVLGAIFLSTLPARGATAGSASDAAASAISIHAPREGSDA